MPNEHKYFSEGSLSDSNYCTSTAIENLDEEPIFTDGIPVLTDRLSAIELQIAQSLNKRNIESMCVTNKRKGLLGGFWLRKKNSECV